MTDDYSSEELSADELAAIHDLLDDPAMWAEPSAEVESRVLASITSIAGSPATDVGPQAVPAADPYFGATTALPADGAREAAPADLSAHRRRRRRGLGLMPLAAAAALVIVALGALAVITRQGSSTELETVALAGTEAAPSASAVARIEPRPNGDRILLEVSGLDAAPDGSFYTVWVVREEPRTRIPAGSFHMRGGDAEIELWAGVSTGTYRTVTITLNREDDPAGPGELVLRGQLDG
jgi:hypothetical protein